MPVLKFTPSQAQAVLHRLRIGDAIADCFADTDGMEHLVPSTAFRADEMVKELQVSGCITVDQESELDEAILTDSIDGSTWVAVHEDESSQKRAAAYNALAGAARVIEVGFGLSERAISIPTA